MATDGDLVGGHSRVGVGKELLDLRCTLAAGLRQVDERGWNFDRPICLPHRAEILVRREAGAGAVLGPFVGDQAQIGHDVEHGGWIRQAGRVRTLRRPLAVRVLRPQAMDDESRVGAIAFRAVAMIMAILRRPGEGEQVIVEAASGCGRCPRIVGGTGIGDARVGGLFCRLAAGILTAYKDRQAESVQPTCPQSLLDSHSPSRGLPAADQHFSVRNCTAGLIGRGTPGRTVCIVNRIQIDDADGCKFRQDEIDGALRFRAHF